MGDILLLAFVWLTTAWSYLFVFLVVAVPLLGGVTFLSTEGVDGTIVSGAFVGAILLAVAASCFMNYGFEVGREHRATQAAVRALEAESFREAFPRDDR